MFFCGNVYFMIKIDEMLIVKDLDEFKELEKFEVESYDCVKEIRKEIFYEVCYYNFVFFGKGGI